MYEENNIVKGFAIGNRRNENYDCELYALYVEPEYQNQGIGTKLLEYMKTHYRSSGYKNMIIWTIKGLQNNSFYKAKGGKIQGEKEYDYGNKKYPGIGFVYKL
ncbi:MAG: GNAT family N-acetyltransferase [Treponema sp.]|nr:GNAT family N-acetyltransferase [Treponema sp.]